MNISSATYYIDMEVFDNASAANPQRAAQFQAARAKAVEAIDAIKAGTLNPVFDTAPPNWNRIKAER
jgi:4'-phosphopantetheinyl transferase EntD